MTIKYIVVCSLLKLMSSIDDASAFTIQDWAYDTQQRTLPEILNESEQKEKDSHEDNVDKHDHSTNARPGRQPTIAESRLNVPEYENEVKPAEVEAPKEPAKVEGNDVHEENNTENVANENDETTFPPINDWWAVTSDTLLGADEAKKVENAKEEAVKVVDNATSHDVLKENKPIAIPAPEHSDKGSKDDAVAIIPHTSSDEASTTSGNENAIIEDTGNITREMHEDILKKIDETVQVLDARLKQFLSEVSVSAHDLKYYEKLLETAYSMFCKEITGHLVTDDNAPSTSSVNVNISAEMSSAIRRSFDSKIEVLELAASEVAGKKSKEIGARTIHDALVKGLLHMKTIVKAPGLTIRKTTKEMKTLNGIVEDISKMLADEVISTTLAHDAAKKKLFDKIQERDAFMNSKGLNAHLVEKFTHEIHNLASTLHKDQSKKADAIETQNGFKQYMDSMRKDMNTLQRVIDTYFATVHNGHAKAILREATDELKKNDVAESQLRLHIAEGQVHDDAVKESHIETSHLKCPPRYLPLHADKPIGQDNPCVREDSFLSTS